jgi:hypothetical protein
MYIRPQVTAPNCESILIKLDIMDLHKILSKWFVFYLVWFILRGVPWKILFEFDMHCFYYAIITMFRFPSLEF